MRRCFNGYFMVISSQTAVILTVYRYCKETFTQHIIEVYRLNIFHTISHQDVTDSIFSSTEEILQASSVYPNADMWKRRYHRTYSGNRAVDYQSPHTGWGISTLQRQCLKRPSWIHQSVRPNANVGARRRSHMFPTNSEDTDRCGTKNEKDVAVWKQTPGKLSVLHRKNVGNNHPQCGKWSFTGW